MPNAHISATALTLTLQLCLLTLSWEKQLSLIVS